MVGWQISSLLPSQLHRTQSKIEPAVLVRSHMFPRRRDSDPDKAEAVDAVSDVSSNELSGPEDGECESDREFGEEDKPKVPRARPSLLPLPRAPEPGVPSVHTVPTAPPAPSLPPVTETETPSDNKLETFDPPSDLEDISPERESATEDPSDPFADFVPEEVKQEEIKEPEFENFSPDPPQFEVCIAPPFLPALTGLLPRTHRSRSP